MRCLGESWQVVRPVEFVVESLSSDPSLAPCPEPALSVLRISFDLQLAEQSGSFEIAVPRSFFDSLAPAERVPGTSGARRLRRGTGSAMRGFLKTQKLNWKCCLEGTHLSFGDLRALRQGQVVRFDHGLNQALRGVVNGDVSVIGHVLSAGNKRAFQVEETFRLERPELRSGPGGAPSASAAFWFAAFSARPAASHRRSSWPRPWIKSIRSRSSSESFAHARHA